MTLRPSNLPKLAICACFEPNPDAGQAAARGTKLDGVFRRRVLGDKSDDTAVEKDELDAVDWAVNMLRAIAGTAEIITTEERCKIECLGLTGTADAWLPELGMSADLKTGQLRNYREQMLDAIVTEMGGFHRGATFAQIVAAVLPQLRLALPEIGQMDGGRIVGFLLDHLTNERERDSFRIRYQCTTAEGAIEWALAIFKLVELVDSEDGQPRYVAKPEAINIYLQSLGVELEAQQVAADAALQHFIRHGKLDEAALAARDALARTIGYYEHIRRALRLAERSIESVDWVNAVQPQLKRARDHIEERLQAEDSLAAEAERKMSETDQAGREKLVYVKEQLEAAARKHNELLTIVIGAGRIFLDEHARQSFRPVALAPYPHPQNAVLKPLLQRPVGETDAWLTASWHVLYPPRIAPVADLSLMGGRLWQERRATELAQEIALPDLEPIEEPPPPFADEVKTRAESAFDALPPRARLSEWLAKLETTDADARQLAVLLAGQWFEGSEEEIVVAADGRQLAEKDAYGDDLLFTRDGHA